MTDDSRDAIDALLSADLDEETTADEHAHIEADPALAARREELRRASALVGQAPAPLSEASVDQLIRGAVAGAPASSATLHPPPRTLRGRRSGPPPVLVAAVVVLLAAIGIGLIVTAKSPVTNKADQADRAAPVHGDAKSAAPNALATSVPSTTASAGSNRESADAAARPLGFIGDYASPATLRARLATRLPAPQRSSAFQTPLLSRGQADRCATVLEARDPRLLRTNRRAAVAASIKGTPVVVFEYRAKAVDNARTTTRVVALGVTACDERVDFER